MTKEEMKTLKELLEPINKKLENVENELSNVKNELSLVKEKTKLIPAMGNRIEEISIDTNKTKLDVMQIKLIQTTNTRNIKIIKLDGEKTKEDIKGMSALVQQILDIIVTREEYEELKTRVRLLESL